MVTACVIHYQGDLESTMRYIGGVHTGAHRDTTTTLNTITGIVDDRTLADLRRIWTQGVPNKCNATSTQKNYQAFKKYGNHSSVKNNIEIMKQVSAKDNKRGFNIIMDSRLEPYLLNAHLTPAGLVIKPDKKPRPVFDSSFRPEVWAMAINDWTDKCNEPPLIFPGAFHGLLTHLYNLRITYPFLVLCLGDDDISGAFRHGKYHPALVAMHLCLLGNILVAATGTTFGDNTSPSNFEPVAQARRQLAQHYWSNVSPAETANTVHNHLPPLTLAKPPTPTEIAVYQQADPDSQNRGVLNPDGTQQPPSIPHPRG